jgi:hypothetical protein
MRLAPGGAYPRCRAILLVSEDPMRTIALAVPAWVAARCANPPDPDDLWSISPEHPTTSDDVSVVFADDPASIRGLAVTVTWRNGGRSFTGLTLPASETTRGEVWRVEVAATWMGDGTGARSTAPDPDPPSRRRHRPRRG